MEYANPLEQDAAIFRRQVYFWRMILGLPASPENRSRSLSVLTDKVFNALTPREEKVLRLRFGFKDGRRHRQVEIAEDLGVSQPTVSRVERRALRKLRIPARVKMVTSFVFDRGLRASHRD